MKQRKAKNIITTEFGPLDVSLFGAAGGDAAKAFIDGKHFLILMENTAGLAFVFDNWPTLQRRGIYEATLLDAYTSTRVNWHNWDLAAIAFLFELADRDKLRSAGEPLPPGDSFTLFRGVAGAGKARKPSGMSWTRDHDRAAWFARRLGLANPAVYTATANAAAVYAYSNERNEDDFIFRAKRPRKVADL